MISPTAIQDFEAACESVRYDAERAAHQACMTVAAQGQPGNSRRNIVMDGAAATVFEAHAVAVHDLLDRLNAADPPADPMARRQQLGDLIEVQLRKLGHVVEGALRQHAGLAMMTLTNPYLPTQLNGSVDSAIRKYRGQLGLSASAVGSTRSQPQVVHSPVFHAPVGSYQAGDRNTATVTQSVVTQVTPGEVKDALDALIQALQSAHGVPADDREAVGRMLEQLKAEADSEKPNKRTVGTLVAGSRDVAELLVAAPGAWETVKNWATFIGTNAVLAAPAIGQAIQGLTG